MALSCINYGNKFDSNEAISCSDVAQLVTKRQTVRLSSIGHHTSNPMYWRNTYMSWLGMMKNCWFVGESMNG